jgi:hypothetical protein
MKMLPNRESTRGRASRWSTIAQQLLTGVGLGQPNQEETMGASSFTPRTGKPSPLAAGISMRFGAIVATLTVQAVLLFGGAGTLHWPWAWICFAISLAIFLINGAHMLRLSPVTIAERGRPGEIRAFHRRGGDWSGWKTATTA